MPCNRPQPARRLGLLGLGKKATIAAEASSPVKIEEPFHGAILNHRHGQQTADVADDSRLPAPPRPAAA